jgi:Sec-independent protein translocase protein TatA
MREGGRSTDDAVGGKLPEVGAGLGRAMRGFHKARSDVVDSVVRSSSEPTEPGRLGEESTGT